MRSSVVAFCLLAVAGTAIAAPTPGGFGFSSGNGGNGGSASTGNSGNVNGGSVITTGYGWGPVYTGPCKYCFLLAYILLAAG